MHPPPTRAHASFLDHCSGKPTGSNPPALVTMQQPVLVCTSSRATDQPEPFHIRPRRIDSLHPLPSQQFQALFNSLFKVLFIFPSQYLFAVSRPYLALDGIYHPIRATFPKNLTCRQRLVMRQGPRPTRLSPSQAPPSKGLGLGPPLRTLLQTTIQATPPPDFHAGLFPVRSPLLGESL